MRTTEDYKRLIKGYSFSFSILKELKPKFYNKMMLCKALFDERGEKFTDFVRNLRMDFINEHDSKEVEVPLISTLDYGLFKEMIALSYLPEDNYTFGMLYEKESMLLKKRVFCEIFPTTLEEVKQNIVTAVLRISTIDEANAIKRSLNYYATIVEDSLMIFAQDADKPEKIKAGLDIPLDEIDNVCVDLTNVF